MSTMILDVSKNSTGLLICRKEKVIKLESIKAEKKDEKEIYIDFFSKIEDIVRTYCVTGVVIEDYAYSAISRGKNALAEMMGIIKLILYKYEIPFEMLNNQIWKSVVGIKLPGKNGKRSKEKYIEIAKKELCNDEIHTTDEADVLMMHQAILMMKRGHINSMAQREFIGNILKKDIL